MDNEDHDILIEIKTKQDLFFEHFTKHIEDDSARWSEISTSLRDVNKRIDQQNGKISWLAIIGVLAIVLLGIGMAVTT